MSIAERFLGHFIVPHFWRKVVIMVLAIFGMGFFLSFLIEAEFGTDPCSFMNRNIASRLGLTLGRLQVLSNAVLFIIMLIFARKLIGFGTFFNWIFIGFIADFFCALWIKIGLHDFIFTSGNFYWRVLIFAAAILCFVISAATYMNAELGVAPYDAFALVLWGWVKNVPFFLVRILYDLAAISIGLFASLSNPLGRQGSLVGTVILAFSIGPAVTLVGKFMKKYVLRF